MPAKPPKTESRSPALLYHFSEDPGIKVFRRQPLASDPSSEPLVWAIDEEHSFLYFFPRDCPRVAGWALPSSSAQDIDRFLGLTAARRVVAIESGWLDRLRSAQIYRYALPADGFDALGDIGMHVSSKPVEPGGMEAVGDLMAALTAAAVELRITPSLWPLADALVASSLHFSLIRMRNAQPRHGANEKPV